LVNIIVKIGEGRKMMGEAARLGKRGWRGGSQYL
jgi:hypothetical protein